MNTIKHTIVESIKKNTLTMTPRWKFVLYSVLIGSAFAFTFLLTIFVISLVFFLLSRYGFMYMPLFGATATLHALKAIPLSLLVCTLILIVFIEVFARYYSFGFKRPLIITLLGISFVAFCVGFVTSELGIHEYMRTYAQHHRLEMVERMYKRPLPFAQENVVDIVRGKVLRSASGTMTLESFDGSVIDVPLKISSQNTSFVAETGDEVMIFGDYEGGGFVGKEIRLVPTTPFGAHMHRGGGMGRYGTTSGMTTYEMMHQMK